MSKLLSVSDALDQILEYIVPVDITQIPLDESAGYVLAEEIITRIDLPSFTNSSMDGFAVRASDIENASPEHPIRLKVVGDIPAGKSAKIEIERGESVRIMTGAVLPLGADTIAPVEITDFNDRTPDAEVPESVQVYQRVKSGTYIRPKGQDVRAGEKILEPGIRLRPQEVGFLAMIGTQFVRTYKKPLVALLSSGDELMQAGAPLEKGKIYDSNVYTLGSQVSNYGGDLINLGVASDLIEAVQRLLDRAVSKKVDLIVSSAGVSVGAFDFIRAVVEKYGKLKFWRVNMRPGKPVAFGSYKGIPFIGLPGNPVSAFVGFEVFVRPIILKMSGQVDLMHPVLRVVLDEDIESDGRESYLRAVVNELDGNYYARLTGHQGSGNLLSLVQSNALLIVPSEVKFIPRGSEIEAWML
jgi:molybdopterin molybdotransferase